MVLSSICTYNTNVSQHISKGELEDLKHLSHNKHTVIRKFDKGNFIIIVDRDKILEHGDFIIANFISRLWKIPILSISLLDKQSTLVKSKS